MAFAYTEGSITDLDIQPGSYQKVPDPEDVGGTNEPHIRVADDMKHRFVVFVEPTGNTTGLTLTNIVEMATSVLTTWSIKCTDTTVGTSGTIPDGIIESVRTYGQSALMAEIVVAPSEA